MDMTRGYSSKLLQMLSRAYVILVQSTHPAVDRTDSCSIGLILAK
jgi:hypothetical protein